MAHCSRRLEANHKWKSRLRSGCCRSLHKKSWQVGKFVVVSPSDDSFLRERPCQDPAQTNPQCGSVKQDNQKKTEHKTDSHPQPHENTKKLRIFSLPGNPCGECGHVRGPPTASCGLHLFCAAHEIQQALTRTAGDQLVPRGDCGSLSVRTVALECLTAAGCAKR